MLFLNGPCVNQDNGTSVIPHQGVNHKEYITFPSWSGLFGFIYQYLSAYVCYLDGQELTVG